MASKNLYFIVSGTINLAKKTVNSSRMLSHLGKYDYFGIIKILIDNNFIKYVDQINQPRSSDQILH